MHTHNMFSCRNKRIISTFWLKQDMSKSSAYKINPAQKPKLNGRTDGDMERQHENSMEKNTLSVTMKYYAINTGRF